MKEEIESHSLSKSITTDKFVKVVHHKAAELEKLIPVAWKLMVYTSDEKVIIRYNSSTFRKRKSSKLCGYL